MVTDLPDLLVLVPSRGRPHAAAELTQAFAATSTAGSRLAFVLDDDDPELPAYHEALAALVPLAEGHTTYIVSAPNEERTMVAALNRAAAAAAGSDWFAIGFMGDDHRPRTVGWDAAYLEALRDLGTGLVYGDDGFQRQNLPTQIAMTADIIRALGWMAPPTLHHLFVDNFWRDLGRLTGRLRYLPDVLVEHVHPAAGKAEWDEGHQRVNAPEMYGKDEAAYRAFQVSGGLRTAARAVADLGGPR